jgi:hypothetical protein
MAKLNKSGSILVFLAKSLIVFLSFLFIFNKIRSAQGLSIYIEEFVAELNYYHFLLIVIVIVLALLNWSTEAIKWGFLLQKIQPVKFKGSFKAVVSGIPLGLFTPNRIGETGGRILFLHSDNRVNGVVASLAGNFAQLLITIMIGMVSLAFLFKGVFSHLYIFSLLAIPALLLLFLNINKMPGIMNIKYSKYFHALGNYSMVELLKVFMLSLGRYFIFFTQFILLLYLFNISLTIKEAFEFIPMVFLTISVVPSYALAEWGIRGSASLYFLGQVSNNHEGILAAATLLWIINIAMPAVIGLGFITRAKV